MFVTIYVQPMWRLTLVALLCMELYRGFSFRMENKGRGKGLRLLTAVLLGIWLLAVLWVTLRRGGGTRELILVPFRSMYLGFTENVEYFRTMFMNVLLFLPGGFLGGMLVRKERRKWLVLGLIFLSVAIESLQFGLCLGRAEVDDLICNGCGALLGVVCAVCPRGDAVK